MKKLITTFTAERRDYGIEVKIAGCKELAPPKNMPDDVIGTIQLKDQLVPILSNSQVNTAGELPDESCIVLFENTISDTTIFTGRLYDNADEVYDLITQFMDCPKDEEQQFLDGSRSDLAANDPTQVG